MDKKFTVINRQSTSIVKDKEIKVKQLYLKAFGKELAAIYSCGQFIECRENLKRAVFYIIKYYGLQRIDYRRSKPCTLEEVNNDFNLLECAKALMRQLTPQEFMTMFPIAKEYDGEKWGCKDYYYTVDKLKSYDLTAPLGEDGLDEFLWEYYNEDLFAFDATAMSILSNLYKANTGKGIMEEWCEKQGIGTYTVDNDLGVIKNNQTGEINKLSKKPLHLQIVK